MCLSTIDRLNRCSKYYTVNTWRKCFAWSGSGTKNVPGPDRIDLVPVRNKTRYGSGTITTNDRELVRSPHSGTGASIQRHFMTASRAECAYVWLHSVAGFPTS